MVSLDEVIREGSQESVEVGTSLDQAFTWLRGEFSKKTSELLKKAMQGYTTSKKKLSKMSDEQTTMFALMNQEKQELQDYHEILNSLKEERDVAINQAAHLTGQGCYGQAQEILDDALEANSMIVTGSIELMEEKVEASANKAGILSYMNDQLGEVINNMRSRAPELNDYCDKK